MSKISTEIDPGELRNVTGGAFRLPAGALPFPDVHGGWTEVKSQAPDVMERYISRNGRATPWRPMV